MKIPERLAQLILEKIGQNKKENEFPKKNEFSSKESKIDFTSKTSELDVLFAEYQKSVVGNDKYLNSLETLRKILMNIVDHPKEEKFRKIKLNNPLFLERIRPYSPALKILNHVIFFILRDLICKLRWISIQMRLFFL